MIQSGLFEVPALDTKSSPGGSISRKVASLEEVLEKERKKQHLIYPSFSQGITLVSSSRPDGEKAFRKSIPARPFDKAFPAFSPIYNRQKDNLRERPFM
mmetsp:Transcript_7539/g.11746  ORF Transcript_7539/g.11746 Transcript_7539/m.11746 type:complete len:99 (+) Transcript_7539:647-943(+)